MFKYLLRNLFKVQLFEENFEGKKLPIWVFNFYSDDAGSFNYVMKDKDFFYFVNLLNTNKCITLLGSYQSKNKKINFDEFTVLLDLKNSSEDEKSELRKYLISCKAALIIKE